MTYTIIASIVLMHNFTMSHSFTDAELSTNVLISKVSLPTVGKFNCMLTCLAGYIRSLMATRVKNDLSILSSLLIIWSRNKGLGCLQQYRVIIAADMHC